MAMAQQLAPCDTCFLLKPVEDYARPDGRWETACLACRSTTTHAAKRARTAAVDGEPANQQAGGPDDGDAEAAPENQVEALMRIDLFQGALRNAAPEAARAGMQQVLEWHRRGWLGAEALAEVALAYLAQHAQQAEQREQQEQPRQQGAPSPGPGPATQQQQQQQHPPLAGPPGAVPGLAPGAPRPVNGEAAAPTAASLGPLQPQGQGSATGQVPARAVQQAAVDAVAPQVLRIVLEVAPVRCRHRLFALARRSPLVLGLLLSSADPGTLLAEGQLAPEDLMAALQPPAGQPPLPAAAAVAAAAALLASAPPGPSPQLLQLVRLLAEGHRLMVIVEAGHLAPAELRAALVGAPPEAFTDIFKAMCSSDAAGQSFLKQAMQRAMPRADYGELMRISMLAEVARTAATVTDRATLLGLLDKAFAA
ncbi:hypothetical protein ABPG75_010416 [Micractinium tetrahymenae]